MSFPLKAFVRGLTLLPSLPPVLDVESRCNIDVHRTGSGPEDGTVPQDSAEGHVFDSGLGDFNWRDGELRYVPRLLLFRRLSGS